MIQQNHQTSYFSTVKNYFFIFHSTFSKLSMITYQKLHYDPLKYTICHRKNGKYVEIEALFLIQNVNYLTVEKKNIR